jgi:hypothetical protein
MRGPGRLDRKDFYTDNPRRFRTSTGIFLFMTVVHLNTPRSPSDATVDAGDFGLWLSQARAALRGNGGMNVPCGDCVGCCTSGYSVFLRPHDKAIDIVPAKFLSGVPGRAYPHAKMDPLHNGHCPMFSEGKCSIYSSRPQTCLDYDCRIFAAAGIEAGASRPVINERVKAWRFTFNNEDELIAYRAVNSAAEFIRQNAKLLPANWNATSPSAIAVLAIKTYQVFTDEASDRSAKEICQQVIEAVRTFDSEG